MKKLIYAVAVLAMTILTSCGGSGNGNDKKQADQTATEGNMRSNPVAATTAATTTAASPTAVPTGNDPSIFMPSWEDSQPTGTPLISGFYTVTGKTYCNGKASTTYACCGQGMYINVYNDQLEVITNAFNSPDELRLTYQLAQVDGAGKRLYRRDNTDAFIVDAKGTVQRMTSVYTYGGNMRTDTYWELIPGDHREEYLKRLEGALEWERMKTTMDLDDYGW